MLPLHGAIKKSEASLHLVKGRHFTKIGERHNLYLNQRDAVFALDMK
jgi:hypothetical protein